MSEAYAEIFTQPIPAEQSRFPDFWKAWPSNERKVAKRQCEQTWKARKLDRIADRIIEHVERMKQTDTWVKGFVPMPRTYLNQDRWEASPKPLIGVQSDDHLKTRAYLEQKAKERVEAPAHVLQNLAHLRQKLNGGFR